MAARPPGLRSPHSPRRTSFRKGLRSIGGSEIFVRAMPTLCPRIPRLLQFISLAIAGGLAACSTATRPAMPTKAEVSKADQVQYLFVQTARSATFEDGTVTLHDVSPVTVFFSDRPERIAGHGTTQQFVGSWTGGRSSFDADPPNATLAMFVDGEAEIREVVVTLREPRLANDELSYAVTVLEGEVPASAGATSLFIDAMGFEGGGAILRGARGFR